MNDSWLQFAQEKTSPPNISGKWFVIRFAPDIITGEVFNIGVVFIDEIESCHYRLIDNTNAFKCLFGSLGVANIGFMLEVLKESLDDNYYKFPPSPHLIYGNQQTANGDNVQEILDDLFDSMVSLICHDEEKDEAKETHTLTTPKLRNQVFRDMKKRYPEVYKKAYRSEPFRMQNPQSKKEITVDMPIAYYSGLEHTTRQDYYASIVSAAYLSSVHRIHQINYVGVTNVTNLCELLGQDEVAKAALIIYLPEPDEFFTEKHLIEAEYELDKCLYSLTQLEKDGYDIKIEIERSQEKCLETAIGFIHS